MSRLAQILVITATLAGLAAEPRTTQSDEVIEKYEQAVQQQQGATKGVAMDVTMEASIPRLQKQGKLNALRRISSLGKITYKVLGFSGDDTVKKEVIARYMTAEVDSAENRSAEIAINPANYSFKYKGRLSMNGQQIYMFDVKPRAKRVGLFKGDLWVDAKTYLPLREQGRLVKSPSVFIKKVDFVREYEIRDGVAYLKHMESKTDTRIVGVAELNINYANYHKATPAEEEPSTEEARN